jgi:hypothetical protein
MRSRVRARSPRAGRSASPAASSVSDSVGSGSASPAASPRAPPLGTSALAWLSPSPGAVLPEFWLLAGVLALIRLAGVVVLQSVSDCDQTFNYEECVDS